MSGGEEVDKTQTQLLLHRIWWPGQVVSRAPQDLGPAIKALLSTLTK